MKKLFYALIFCFAAICTAHAASGGDDCVEIRTRTGEIISAKLDHLNDTEVYYRDCKKENGVLLRISKANIIKIVNSRDDVIFDGATYAQRGGSASNTGHDAPLNGLALAGFICSIITGPLLGLIFSIIATTEVKNNPGRYSKSSAGFATAGIVISCLWILIYLALLSPRR